MNGTTDKNSLLIPPTFLTKPDLRIFKDFSNAVQNTLKEPDTFQSISRPQNTHTHTPF